MKGLNCQHAPIVLLHSTQEALLGRSKQRVKSSTQAESNNQVVSPIGAEVQKNTKSKSQSKIQAGVKNQKVIEQTDEGKRKGS